MSILVLKHIHITLALLSVSGFVIRYTGQRLNATFVTWRITRVLPHLIDTLLLVSGISLAWFSRLSPLEAHWLLVKLILIVVYIFLGEGAMHARQTGSGDILAVIGLCVIALVVTLAIFKPF